MGAANSPRGPNIKYPEQAKRDKTNLGSSQNYGVDSMSLNKFRADVVSDDTSSIAANSHVAAAPGSLRKFSVVPNAAEIAEVTRDRDGGDISTPVGSRLREFAADLGAQPAAEC